MVEASKQEVEQATKVCLKDHLADEPIADEINFDDFMKVDLRVARIVKG
jgi:methionyl-tRNA synthetase